MKPTPQSLFVLALLLAQWLSAAPWEHPTDPIKDTDSLTIKAKTGAALQQRLQQWAAHNTSALGLGSYIPEKTKTLRSFPKLDQQLVEQGRFHINYDQTFEPEFDDTYIETNFQQSQRVDSLVKKADQLIKKLEEFGNFVDVLTGDKLLQLPVGLRKRDPTSGNEIVIAVSSVRFHAEYAELKLWAKMDIPQSDKSLYFGAEGVKFSRQGALVGDAKLTLLGDFPIAFNGDNWLLTLKGGHDLKTGNFSSKSYLSIDCNGLKEISLNGNLKVSRRVLLPLNEDGSYMCGDDKSDFPKDEKGEKTAQNTCYVETDFLVQSSGWNDVLIEVTLPDFEMVGLKKWAFKLQHAVLDLSDTRNSENINFPDAYNQLLPQENKNLWRGIYAKQLKIQLPDSFKKITGNGERITFNAEDLLLDSFGVSGKFSATNLIKQGEGALHKWGFTLDSLGLVVVTNSIRGGSLAGNIKVPIIKQPLGYEGWIAENEYGLRVSLLNHAEEGQKPTEYDVPVFLGKMTLLPNSSVAVKVKDGNFYPSANLTGSITVKGDLTQDGTTTDTTNSSTDGGNASTPPKDDLTRADGFQFRGISFQELQLQTEPDKPYIQAKHFGFDGEFKLLFFPVTISKMELVTPSKTEAGLKFDMAIHLDDKSNKGASTSLSILGKLEDERKLHSWEFDRVAIGKIGVDFNRGGVHISGEVEIKNNDPEFGDGFGGNLTAKIEKLNLEVGGKGMFGAKPIAEDDGDTFRYWFVDAWQKKTEGGDGKLLLSSFMGGISSHMRRTDGNSVWTPTGSTYTPDYEVGLGLRAGVSIGVTKKATFRGKAVLEMVFNRIGGLNRIGFMGEGAFMTALDEGDIEDKELKEVQKWVNEWAEANPDAYKRYNSNGAYLDAARDAIPIREIASSGKIGAYLGIERDFTTNTFHGTFELYLSTQGLRGAGPNNKAGFATLHTSPDEWYLHVGTPTDRLGLVFSVGGDLELEVGGYFMTGNMLPSQLAPHPRVIQILGSDILDDNRRPNELSRGSGFAFGLNFSLRKSFQYYIFYATLEVGSGFDVMHRYYPDVRCKGRSGPVGNNGWYSMGNVYSWLYGEFGVGVKLLFIKKRIKIAEAGIAALLHGQFPNPSYFKGYVGMYFSVLGGLVKGRLRLKISFGDKCEMENINPFTEIPIISDLTPVDGANEVDVFTAPQAVFNFAVEQPFSLDTEEGYQTFKINLKSFDVQSEGKTIPGQLEWNRGRDAVTFIPEEVLPSKKEVTVTVEVTFQEKVGNSWQVITQGGKPAVEKRTSKFTTDLAPDHIPLHNIAFMYPVIDQKNLYPKEYDKGYIKLKRGQTYLFDGGYSIKAQFNENGTATRTQLGYNSADKMVHFELPEMGTSTPFTMDIMAFPPSNNEPAEVVVVEETQTFDGESGDTSWYNPADGGTTTENAGASVTVASKKAANVIIANAEPKSLLHYGFNTSQHPTFKSKMRSLSIVDNITDIMAADIHSIHLKVRPYENFDVPEVLGTKYTNGDPMVYGEAILRDTYYNRTIHPLVYENYPLDGTIRVDREEALLGVPPVRGMTVPDWYAFYLQNQPTSTYVTERYPLMYNLPYFYKKDFLHLQYTLVNRYVDQGSNPEMYNRYQYIIEGQFPALQLGTYKTYLI
ncbi:MAG: Ig-like domain-containing protein, partial [Flavobacteriaceae bacterium]